MTLARIMHSKVLDTLAGPSFRFIEAKFGNYPVDMERGGSPHRAGTPIAWGPAEVAECRLAGAAPDGSAIEVNWEDVAGDPGWCKLDWVVADPVRGEVANASNMLDVTWEAPDGSITPLDGYLDPYFQEVYLEAESVPLVHQVGQAHVRRCPRRLTWVNSRPRSASTW